MTKVGAIVVNYKSNGTLKECLAAIANQRVCFERILLMDNDWEASPLANSKAIRADLKKITYIKLDQNVGFAKANNIALAELSDCSWVAMVNPDAFLHPLWLEHMVDGVNRYPNHAFFASRLMMAGKDGRCDGVGDVYHASGLAWRNGHGYHVGDLPEKEVFSPCAAAALYRYDALKAVNGFDEDYFCYFEDVDLGFRLRLAGHRCMLIPQAVAYHVGGATTGGRHSNFAIYHGHRNAVWTFFKNMPSVLFWVLLPYHIAINLASIIWFACQGKAKVIIRAKIDAIRGIPKMLVKRKSIQMKSKGRLHDIVKIIDKRFLPSRKPNFN